MNEYLEYKSFTRVNEDANNAAVSIAGSRKSRGIWEKNTRARCLRGGSFKNASTKLHTVCQDY